MNYPIYFTKGAGARDDYAATVTNADHARQALEHFAADRQIDYFSLDTSSGRMFICLPNCAGFYYTWLDDIADAPVAS